MMNYDKNNMQAAHSGQPAYAHDGFSSGGHAEKKSKYFCNTLHRHTIYSCWTSSAHHADVVMMMIEPQYLRIRRNPLFIFLSP